MVPVLVPTDDARAHQGYCCSVWRPNRYCCAVGRHAGSNRISFVLKTFGRAALQHVRGTPSPKPMDSFFRPPRYRVQAPT